MLNIRLIISKPNPEEDSFILIDNKLTTFPNSNQCGLRKYIRAFFRENKWLNEIMAYSNPVWGPNKTIRELVDVDPLRFLSKMGWEKIPEDSELAVKTHLLITLVEWARKRSPFRQEEPNCRACIICNEMQFGEHTGQMTGGFSTHINNSPCNKEMYSFKSDNCLNPDCLSHNLNFLVNLDYIRPKEVCGRQTNRFLIKKHSPIQK